MTFQLDMFTDNYFARSAQLNVAFDDTWSKYKRFRDFFTRQSKKIDQYNRDNAGNLCNTERLDSRTMLLNDRPPYERKTFNAGIPRGFPLLDTRMTRARHFLIHINTVSSNAQIPMLAKCDILIKLATRIGVQFIDFCYTDTNGKRVPFPVFDTFTKFRATPDALLLELRACRTKTIQDANHNVAQTEIIERERVANKLSNPSALTYIEQYLEAIRQLVGYTSPQYTTVDAIRGMIPGARPYATPGEIRNAAAAVTAATNAADNDPVSTDVPAAIAAAAAASLVPEPVILTEVPTPAAPVFDVGPAMLHVVPVLHMNGTGPDPGPPARRPRNGRPQPPALRAAR